MADNPLTLIFTTVNVFKPKTWLTGILTIYFFLGVLFSFDYSEMFFRDEFQDGLGQAIDEGINTPTFFDCVAELGCSVGTEHVSTDASFQITSIKDPLEITGFFEYNYTDLCSVGSIRSGNVLHLPRSHIGYTFDTELSRFIDINNTDHWSVEFNEVISETACAKCISYTVQFKPIATVVTPMRDVNWLMVLANTALNTLLAYSTCLFGVAVPVYLSHKIKYGNLEVRPSPYG